MRFAVGLKPKGKALSKLQKGADALLNRSSSHYASGLNHR